MKKTLSISLLIASLCVGATFAADFFLMGKKAFETKQYPSAAKYFIQALNEDPNNALARYYYAQSLLYLKRYEQARKEFGYVVQLAPDTLAADYSKKSIDYIDKLYNSANIKVEQTNIHTPANDNYIKKALTSQGDLVAWDTKKMPLKIYIDNSYGVKQMYIPAAQKALTAWKNASEGLLDFAYVNSPDEADILVVFKGLAKKTENQTLGLTRHTSQNGKISNVCVTLYTLGPDYKMLTETDVYNVALHEFGHMLGIWGHSDNKSDIMYSLYDIYNQKTMMPLSLRDRNTIKALYEIDRNPYSTSDNSITNVLGSKKDRMQERLQQGLDYIEEIPGNAIGYVNVANTYMSMEDVHQAVVYYKLALKVEPNNKEANLALAAIYFDRKDYSKSEEHLKTLIRLEPKNSQHYCNLSQIYLKNNRVNAAKSTISNLIYRNASAKNDECVKKVMQHFGK